ncbi:MAG: hypothetical protein MR388_00465 [Tenericutes bacterium]|nr:hypothetical protein [Mycoplasmatota bacterium]
MNDVIIKQIEQLLEKKITTGKVIELFYNIGKILDENHYNYYQLAKLDILIRQKYGLMISLSRKNLMKIIKFYQISKEIPLKKLQKIDWNSYLLLINKSNYEELIDIFIENKMNKRELEYYIKTGKMMNICMKYKDPATNEFLKVQQSIIK